MPPNISPTTSSEMRIRSPIFIRLHFLHVTLGNDAANRVPKPQRAQIASCAKIFGHNIHIQVDQQRGNRKLLDYIFIDLV